MCIWMQRGRGLNRLESNNPSFSVFTQLMVFRPWITEKVGQADTKSIIEASRTLRRNVGGQSFRPSSGGCGCEREFRLRSGLTSRSPEVWAKACLVVWFYLCQHAWRGYDSAAISTGLLVKRKGVWATTWPCELGFVTRSQQGEIARFAGLCKLRNTICVSSKGPILGP